MSRYPATVTFEKAVEASTARCQLSIFAAVVGLLEGGDISGSNKAAEKIIRIAKQEQQRQLGLYDKALGRKEI